MYYNNYNYASQPHELTPSDRFKTKTAYFYREGDQRFQPIRIVMKRKEYQSMDVLLKELNDRISLPNGVRALFTPDGRHRIASLDDLENEGHYICSSNETRGQRVDIGNMQRENWVTFTSDPKFIENRDSFTKRHAYLRPAKSDAATAAAAYEEPDYIGQEIKRLHEELYGPPPSADNHHKRKKGRSKSLKRLSSASPRPHHRSNNNNNNNDNYGYNSNDMMQYRTTKITDVGSLPLITPANSNNNNNTKTYARNGYSNNYYETFHNSYYGPPHPAAARKNNNNNNGSLGERNFSLPLLAGGGGGGGGNNNRRIAFADNTYNTRQSNNNNNNNNDLPMIPVPSFNNSYNNDSSPSPSMNSHGKAGGAATGRHHHQHRGSYAATMTDNHRTGFRHWTVRINTGSMPAGVSSSVVFLTIFGRSGSTPKLTLQSEQKAFVAGATDIFKVRVPNVGTVFKIRIESSNTGNLPDWYCESLVLEDDYSMEKYPFVCKNWLSRQFGDRSIVREIAAFGDDIMRPLAPNQVNYEVTVHTGDVWNAGTNGKVFLTIFGERGSSKTFDLNNPTNHEHEAFQKNQSDVFKLVSHPLGEIKHVRVVHFHGQSVGVAATGWYLESIAIRENDLHTQFHFPAWRWLSQFEGDNTLAVDLPAVDNYNYVRLQDRLMWPYERWKFRHMGAELIFYSCTSKKALRITQGGYIDARGETTEKLDARDDGVFQTYDIEENEGDAIVSIINKSESPSFLAFNQQKIISKASYNKSCNLRIHSFSNRTITFESYNNPNQHVSVASNGQLYSESHLKSQPSASHQFYCYVKGCFRDLGIVILGTSRIQTLCVDRDPAALTALGARNRVAHFRVHKVQPRVRMFESVIFPGHFIQAKKKFINCLGKGDQLCEFKLHRSREENFVLLEAAHMRGGFIGFADSGQVQIVNLNKSAANQHACRIYPEAVEFGRRPNAELFDNNNNNRSSLSPTAQRHNRRNNNNNPDDVIYHSPGSPGVVMTASSATTDDVMTMDDGDASGFYFQQDQEPKVRHIGQHLPPPNYNNNNNNNNNGQHRQQGAGAAAHPGGGIDDDDSYYNGPSAPNHNNNNNNNNQQQQQNQHNNNNNHRYNGAASESDDGNYGNSNNPRNANNNNNNNNGNHVMFANSNQPAPHQQQQQQHPNNNNNQQQGHPQPPATPAQQQQPQQQQQHLQPPSTQQQAPPKPAPTPTQQQHQPAPAPAIQQQQVPPKPSPAPAQQHQSQTQQQQPSNHQQPQQQQQQAPPKPPATPAQQQQQPQQQQQQQQPPSTQQQAPPKPPATPAQQQQHNTQPTATQQQQQAPASTNQTQPKPATTTTATTQPTSTAQQAQAQKPVQQQQTATPATTTAATTVQQQQQQQQTPTPAKPPAQQNHPPTAAQQQQASTPAPPAAKPVAATTTTAPTSTAATPKPAATTTTNQPTTTTATTAAKPAAATTTTTSTPATTSTTTATTHPQAQQQQQQQAQTKPTEPAKQPQPQSTAPVTTATPTTSQQPKPQAQPTQPATATTTAAKPAEPVKQQQPASTNQQPAATTAAGQQQQQQAAKPAPAASGTTTTAQPSQPAAAKPPAEPAKPAKPLGPAPTVLPAPKFNAKADAEALQKAMKGGSGDDEALVNILTKRSLEQRQEIAKAYKTAFNKELMKDIEEETDGNFFQVLSSLMKQPIDLAVHNLTASLKANGTDEDGLVEVICTASHGDLQLIKAKYLEVNKQALPEALAKGGNAVFRRLLIAMLASTSSDLTADPAMAKADAKELHEAIAGKDSEKSTVAFTKLLSSRSLAQLRAVFTAYEQDYGKKMDDVLKEEFKGDALKAHLAVVSAIRNPTVYFAQRLHSAMAGFGPKNASLIRIIVSRCEYDLGLVKQEYSKLFGKSLQADVEEETFGDFETALSSLINGNASLK